jgi:hypothetical protein
LRALIHTSAHRQMEWTKGCFTTRDSDVSESPPSGSGRQALSQGCSLADFNFLVRVQFWSHFGNGQLLFPGIHAPPQKIALPPRSFPVHLSPRAHSLVTTCKPFGALRKLALQGVIYPPVRYQFLDKIPTIEIQKTPASDLQFLRWRLAGLSCDSSTRAVRKNYMRMMSFHFRKNCLETT